MSYQEHTTQRLNGYPPSWCDYCEKTTSYDGWDIGNGGMVQFYCDDCGKVKQRETIHIGSIPDTELFLEIMDVIFADLD